VHNLVKTPYPF